MDERVYWIWLQKCLGVGAVQGEQLLDVYHTAKAVFERLTLPFDGLTAAQQKQLRNKDLTDAAEELKKLEALGGWVITPDDEVFAAMFEGMYAPPVAVYGLGERFDPSTAPTVAVVGTRGCDEQGARITRRLSAGLAAGGAVVVSGGAEGIDAHALQAALDEGGRCLSFQACGLDMDYPKATSPLRRRLLESGGMLLSEFPLGEKALRHHFRVRNRLISAVSRGTLVTQAPRKSGALLTAMWAREQGRDVFAVPGSVGVYCCEGSNELLKDGAQPVTNAVDVLMMYMERYPSVIRVDKAIAAEDRAEYAFYHGGKLPPTDVPFEMPMPQVAEKQESAVVRAVPCPETASEEMKRLYASLLEGPKTAAELSAACEMNLSSVLSALTLMELKRLVSCKAGQRYALCEM